MSAYVLKAPILMEIIACLATHNKGYYKSPVIWLKIVEMGYNLWMRNVMMETKIIEMVALIAKPMQVISVIINYYNNHFVTNAKINAENAIIWILTLFV